MMLSKPQDFSNFEDNVENMKYAKVKVSLTGI